MRIPLFHVDAFAEEPFGGNPAAVCLLDSWLDDEQLRKVAAENSLSATAFLVRKGRAYDLRWFTPRCEIRLCGHATLASAYVLFAALKTGDEQLEFHTRFSGSLFVRKEGELFGMDFPALPPEPCRDVPIRVARAIGTPEQPTELLEVNDILIAVFANQRTVQELFPDFALLEELHPRTVAVTAPGENADFVSRYFAPTYGVPEDPVTGSAHCALTAYWTKRLSKTVLHAQQLSERGGTLLCEQKGNRVIVKGGAVLTLRGTLVL